MPPAGCPWLSMTSTHTCPALQCAQVPPPYPHALVEPYPGMHVFPEQQPCEHEVALQTQEPATHCCPDPQGAPLPQRQFPAEQVSAPAPQLRPQLPQSLGVLRSVSHPSAGLLLQSSNPASQVAMRHVPALQVAVA
jgi:hypothetical protein